MRYVVLLLFLTTVVVYGNTLRNKWSYDDIPVVVENSDAHSFSGFLENKRPGRPLRELTYIPEYKLFGVEPAGYRVQQLFWHGANGFLLFLLLRSLGIETLLALLASTFFLVHPLQVESVANISHRKELLALFFSLATLLIHLKAVAAEGARRIILAVAGGLAFGCALLANQTALSLPGVLVLYEFLFVERERRFLLRYPVLAIAGGAVLAGGVLYLFRGFFSYDQMLAIYSKNNFIATKSYYPLFMGDMKSFGLYLSKIIVPIGLAPEYAVTFSEDIVQPAAWGCMALFLGVVSAGAVAARTAPILSFGIGWFLFLYLPVSNFIPAGYMMADRYMYMPLAGISIILAWGLRKIRPQALSAGFGVVLVLFAALTIIQNTYWYDEHTLWRHAADVNPGSTWAQESAAYSYYLKGELNKAREHAKKALEINRFNTKGYLVLARIEERRGDIAEALRNYEMFSQVGEVEYPELVREVREHLPMLQERMRRIELYKRGEHGP
jgi:hypothetical protein